MSDAQQSRQQPPPTLLEWGVRLVGCALLVALAAYLVVSAQRPRTPTRFDYRMAVDEVAREGGEWRVPVKVTNRGSAALADLEIRLRVGGAEETGNEARVTIDLIGSGESKDVVFWVAGDPRRQRHEFDVVGYREP